MGSPALEAVVAAIVLLFPAVGGIYLGASERTAAKVRALSASAFLLMLAGCGGVAVVATRTPGGAPTVVFGFLALWLGVALGTVVAIVACTAGIAHALTQRHWQWVTMLGIGALLPLIVAALMLAQALGSQRTLAPIRMPSAAAALVSALLLVALAPLVTLIYGLWAADDEARHALE